MKRAEHKKLLNGCNWVCGVLLAALLIFEVLLNLTPPVSRDALIHHLAIPKIWIQQGAMVEIPWAIYSYYPMNIDLIYLGLLFFDSDWLAKSVHMLFGWSTGILIFIYVRNNCSKLLAGVAMAVFLTVPAVIRLSTEAYVDLGLTFFSTASILAVLEWRRSGFIRYRWFFLGSVCMGLAVGSKYNALIVWFIWNLLLIHMVSQSGKSQWRALGDGICFLAITALVASPWYIRNVIWTGNPAYPLFHNAFCQLSSFFGATCQNVYASESDGFGGNFFVLRKVLYGESLWDTLSIPIRVFFSGEDDSYQYFQGSLGPLLLLFLPFSFFAKKWRPERFYLAVLVFCYGFISYFSTFQQVRYLMPIIPFLTILSVWGMKNLAGWARCKKKRWQQDHKTWKDWIRNSVYSGIIVLTLTCFSINISYLMSRWNSVLPSAYLLGQETRDQFLRSHLPYYSAFEYINGNLPLDAVVMMVYVGHRGYYLNRQYRQDPSFGLEFMRQLLSLSNDPIAIQNYFKQFGITHVLVRKDLTLSALKDNFTNDEQKRVVAVFRRHWHKIYENNRYLLVKVMPSS